MDDYSFGWTSAAGFIAEFCALGGKITKRVFPPLNTTDYSSYVAQLDPPNADRRLLLGGRRHAARSRRSRRSSNALTEATVPVAAESAGSILRLRGVGRRFGGVQAVRDVDLDVAHGERRAILGPNGAGKTTLFNLIAGDFQPTSGTIDLMGTDVTNLPARMRPRLGVARTYQKSRLFPGLTVEDNLYLAIVGRDGGRLRPVRSAAREREQRERARAAAERVWLGDSLDSARRLALARAAAPARGRAWRARPSRS